MDKSASPSVGSDCVKGIGFTGLVTFSGDNLVAGNTTYNPIKYINGTISGEASVTQINGAAIKTGTIQADRFVSTPILAIGSLTPSSNGTLTISDLEGSNGLNLGTFAKLSSLSLGSSSLTGSLPESQGGTGATSYSAAFTSAFNAAGGAFEADIFDGDPSNSNTRLVSSFKNTINASGIALEADIFNGNPSDSASTGSFTTQFRAQLAASGLFLTSIQQEFTANTSITAGKIVLSTEAGSSGGSVELNSGTKQILVKDGSGNTRVILGKL